MKLLIIKFSPVSYYFLPLRAKYLLSFYSQTSSVLFFPQCKRPGFTHIKEMDKVRFCKLATKHLTLTSHLPLQVCTCLSSNNGTEVTLPITCNMLEADVSCHYLTSLFLSLDLHKDRGCKKHSTNLNDHTMD